LFFLLAGVVPMIFVAIARGHLLRMAAANPPATGRSADFERAVPAKGRVPGSLFHVFS